MVALMLQLRAKLLAEAQIKRCGCSPGRGLPHGRGRCGARGETPPIFPYRTISERLADSCLLADLVGCDSIELRVPLDGHRLVAVAVDAVTSTLPNQPKAVLFQEAHKVFALDRH